MALVDKEKGCVFCPTRGEELEKPDADDTEPSLDDNITLTSPEAYARFFGLRNKVRT